MSDRSLTLSRTRFEAIVNAISSRALEAGATPCGSLDGQTIAPSGLDHALVSRSAPRAKALRSPTIDISGRSGFGSFESAFLQGFLASRLRLRLDGVGSILFSMTWRGKPTPAGRPYSQLVASARRTSDNDCGSWPTPKVATGDYQNDRNGNRILNLQGVVKLAFWPTPVREDGESPGSRQKGNTVSHTLSSAAQMASWPTPLSGEAANGASGRSRKGERADLTTVASWTTPSASDGERAGTITPNMTESSLTQMASWATPRVTGNGNHGSPKRATDGRARLEDQVHGTIANGSPAQTAKPGQLNPEFCLWLMGYPPEWESCAPPAMRSSRKSRRNSSAPPAGDYDAQKDLGGSIAEGFRAIRERVAAGGAGWERGK